MKVDLHMHRRISDGSMTIDALAALAKRVSLDAVAITDHDTLAGEEAKQAAGKNHDIHVISRLEISAMSARTGRRAHILGYGVRDAERVERACKPYLDSRQAASLLAVKRIQAAGYPIDRDIALSYVADGGVLYRQHIMYALIDRGYTTMVYGPLNQALFGRNGIAQVKSDYMDALDAIRLVREAGGWPVLAHPFQYDSMDLIPELAAAGLAGIEAYHPTQSPERQRIILDAAAHYGLFITGGSDAHGLYSETPSPVGGIGVTIAVAHPLHSLL